MLRKKAENVGDVLSQYMREVGIETPLAEYRAVQAWPKIAGKAVAARTLDVSLHHQTLYVKLLSPALRNELAMRRASLVSQLNEAAGMQVVFDIHFY